MRKYLIALVGALFLLFADILPAYAAEPDFRVIRMHSVLVNYHSPMAGYEQKLIDTADQYHLDWTLLAAIAGTESSFGIHMPENCVNPYGWGIYGDNRLCFESYDAAIVGVAAGLAASYNLSSLTTIARTYNTVSTASWIAHTRYFMNRIKTAEIPVSSLPVTL